MVLEAVEYSPRLRELTEGPSGWENLLRSTWKVVVSVNCRCISIRSMGKGKKAKEAKVLKELTGIKDEDMPDP